MRRIKALLIVLAIAVIGLIGGLATSAGATAPPLYEVVTATSVATPNTWVTVTGPYTLAQAQAQQLRLFHGKLTTCRFVPASCNYTFTIYRLTKAPSA